MRKWKRIEGGTFRNGDILVLYRDDNTSTPYMTSVSDGEVSCSDTDKMVEIDEQGNTIRTYKSGDKLNEGTLVKHLDKPPLSCKIDLSWVFGAAKELIANKILENLYARGAKWRDASSVPKSVYIEYLIVKNGIISCTNDKEVFEGKKDGHCLSKEEISTIQEAHVNSAILDKFPKMKEKDTISKKEYVVSLEKYEGKERECVSRAIQENAFKQGYKWQGGETTPLLMNLPFLYFKLLSKTITCAFTFTPDNHPNIEIISVVDVLSGKSLK